MLSTTNSAFPLYSPSHLFEELRALTRPRQQAKELLDLWKRRGLGQDYIVCALALFERLDGTAKALKRVKRLVGSRLSEPVATTGSGQAWEQDQVTEDMCAALVCKQLESCIILSRSGESTVAVVKRFVENIASLAQFQGFTLQCLPVVHYAFSLLKRDDSVRIDYSGDLNEHLMSIHLKPMKRLMEDHSTNDLIESVIDQWVEHHPFVWYLALRDLLVVLKISTEESSAIQVVRELIRQSRSSDVSKQERAIRILQGGTREFREGHLVYRTDRELDPFNHPEVAVLISVAEDLVEQLPVSMEVVHLYIRWLLNSSRFAEEVLTTHILADDRFESIHRHLEAVIYQLFGEDYWKVFCSTTFPLESGSEAEQRFREAQAASHPEKHDSDLAEGLELLAAEMDEGLDLARLVAEECLDVLSGGVVRVNSTTHLYPSWMSLKRRPDEFMGQQFPKVELCRRALGDEVGAACRFRLSVPGIPGHVQGDVDATGSIVMDNVLVLNETSRSLVRTVVLDALRAVLVPSIREGAPVLKDPTGGLLPLGEPTAQRPVVHAEGILGELSSTYVPTGESRRIHPIVATWLFSWILGLRQDISFDLFRRTGSAHNQLFCLAPSGREQLMETGDLSALFVRSIRAYTVPVGARVIDGSVVLRQMSGLAQKRYQQYLKDGGRKLCFDPVTKTYILPGAKRVVMSVPRTFNHGTFVSLKNALERVHDPEVKQQVMNHFEIDE